MLGIVAILVVGGLVAYKFFGLDTHSEVSQLPEPAALPMVFEPDVVTHSPAFLARQKKAGTGMRRIQVYGDSLTASDYWKHIQHPADTTVDGKGWPSNRINQIMTKAAPIITSSQPTDVVLLAGANDLAVGHSADVICADLAAAWTALKAAGVRVYAVMLTPWFGYTGGKAGEKQPMFFRNPAVAGKLKTTTEAVRSFIRAAVGTPTGPDVVIETASLGDDQGRLLTKYSRDGLHMFGSGYAALAALVERALFEGAAAVGAEDDPINWPVGWRPAPAAVLAAVNEAVAKFGIPREIIFGILWKESRFNPKLVGYKNAEVTGDPKRDSPRFQKSYRTNKDLLIPGSSMTWGQMFTPKQWTVYSAMQTMPYHVVGKPYGMKAGAPLSQLFDVRKNIMCGASYLADLYAKYGDWPTAILRYNGSPIYCREVLGFAEAFRAAQVA